MEEILKTAIGKRFVQARYNLQKTQKTLAEDLGITPSSLSSIERGANFPSLQTVATLAQKFNIDLNWLLLGAKNNFTPPKTSDIPYLNIIKDLTNQNKLLLDTLLKCQNELNNLSQPL